MHAVFFAVLIEFLRYALPRAAAFFGIYVMADTVSRPIFDYLQNLITQKIGAVSGQFLNAFYLTGFYDAVLIVFAAYALALSIKGLKALAQSRAS